MTQQQILEILELRWLTAEVRVVQVTRGPGSSS